ncbi:methyltransferase domain-containing protein [Streptomyces sp. A5-4]|uniref:methyltransferase domain-containing protein n=1 Tax=Streptomyces sp. A5-4 TaxID=3384771 RepID=UPI003DA807A8
MIPPRAQEGHASLVRSLDERGLLPPPWRQVWEKLPRHRFVPREIWRQGPERCEPVETYDDWCDLVSSDEPVVIQVDDGKEDGPGVATSSNSMPSMVAKMLDLLQVEHDDRVLEIGTASGHVAALLAERLGDHNVHSVEIDPFMAAMAAEHLRAIGYAPNLRLGDGEEGWPQKAPFDRLISTCSLRHVPYAFVEQVRPGGTIVAPLYRDFWSGALVQLTVQADGRARGRFQGGASYMPMRSQRTAAAVEVDSSTARSRSAGLDPEELLSLGFALYAGARLPGVWMRHTRTDGTVHVWARGQDGSATSTATGENVWQYGPRDLWTEIEVVHREYVAIGSPDAGSFGLTVTPRGQHTWTHRPEAIVSPMGDGIHR